jgi:hypothetical protein
MLRLPADPQPAVARAAPRPPAPQSAVLALQRSAGNHAVSRLLARAKADCPGYEAGEVEQSRTPRGVLTHDVMTPGPGYMLVADFGVDRSDVKDSTKQDPDLQRWIAQFHFAGDKADCNGGCTLDRWKAYDNADSYSEFAREAFHTVSQ